MTPKTRLYKQLILIISLSIYCLSNISNISPVLALLFFLTGLFYIGVEVLSVATILFFGPLLGYIGSEMSIPNLGGICVVLSCAYLLVRYRDRVKVLLGPIFLVVILIHYWSLGNYFLGQSYWNEKLGLTLFNGVTSVIGLYFLVTVRHFKVYRLACFLLFGSFLVMATVGSTHGFPRLELDSMLSWFRDNSNPYTSGALVDLDSSLLSYHIPGFIALVSMSLVMNEKKFDGIKSRLIVFLSFLLILISGARQMLFIAALLVIIKELRTKGIKAVFPVLAALILALTLGGTEDWSNFLIGYSLKEVIEQSGRLVHIFHGIEDFLISPLVGAGYKFQSYGFDSKWPHNIIIEILAETGLIGLFVVLGFILIIRSTRVKQSRIDGNSLVLLIFIFRALVSGSLATNIVVLVIPFFYSRNKK